MNRIASILVFDDGGSQLCARLLDVVVPGAWDARRVIDGSRYRLPASMQLTSDDPDLVQFYEMDTDPTFADWTQARPWQQELIF